VAELTLPQAAAALGVSVDTVRRRVKAGTLPSRTGESGRLLVDLPSNSTAGEPPAEQQTAVQPPEPAQQELAHVRELLEEIRLDRDYLRERLQIADQEREQLRILLGNAQHLPALQSGSADAAQQDAVQDWRRWWPLVAAVAALAAVASVLGLRTSLGF
jgi:hypothetical protein